MHPLIADRMQQIVSLCQEFGVARLDVFGSINTAEFDESRSDVDFLVRYREDVDLGPWLARHFELRSRLTELLGRPVDLIMNDQPENPFVRRSMAETRQLLYAA